jgi:predicted nucleic acid-binding protein
VILVDTSVWAQHIDREVVDLSDLLRTGEVLSHPFVVGELAMGNLRRRNAVLADFDLLPRAVCASDEETMLLVERFHLYGTGIGYVDAHLLASARISSATSLWTFDRRLHAEAERLGLAFEP